MITVGLTGGIGSGKSTVAAMLVGRGAILIDADQLAREAVEPGTEAYGVIVARFGEGVVLPGGGIDRPALASVVFADEEARRDLNAIVHPAVGALMAERLAAVASTDSVVVLDIPLLVEGGGRDRYTMAGVLVVDAPIDTAMARLIEDRGMDPADAERRVAAQASREDRLRQADFVIMNMGSLDELEAMVDRAWAWMLALGREGATESNS
jgi:dephospho-CoA kinase